MPETLSSTEIAFLYSTGGSLTMTSPPPPSNVSTAFVNSATASNLTLDNDTYYTSYFGDEGSASVTLGGNTVNVSDFASVYAQAGSSADSATFNDGGADEFVGSIPYSYITNNNNLFEMAVGYSQVTASSSFSPYNFSQPQAYLYSDGGALAMGLSRSSISLGSKNVTVNGYPLVDAFASSSGTDTATFLPGDIQGLGIMSAYSYISTNVDLDSAIGYQTVVANSPGQVFVDVAAGQNFVAGPTSATLTSGTFQATINNFSNLVAIGTSTNTATLNASMGQNFLTAYGTEAGLGESFGSTDSTNAIVSAIGFGVVDVNAPSGSTNQKSLADLGFVIVLTGNWPDG